MTHILVVAHETATSRLLLERVTELRAHDPALRISLLVPETPVNRLLVWEQTESHDAAETRLREARAMFSEAGVEVASWNVGDADPVLAIEDAIRTSGQHYDAVLLSTLAPGRSRWLRIDAPHRAQRSVDVPVLVAIPGDDEAWQESFAALEEYQRTGIPAAHAPPDRPSRFFARPSIWTIVLLMFIYLSGSAVLAVTVDRGFLLNDAVALVLFALMLGAIAYEEWAGLRRLFRRG